MFIGGKTWFTAEVTKTIGRYDPATHRVDWILGTGQNRTHAFAKHVEKTKGVHIFSRSDSGGLEVR
jgi:streptogramin lyase